MPAKSAISTTAPSDLAWRVVGLLNLYRLLVPAVLVGTRIFGSSQAFRAPAHPELFFEACTAYFAAALLVVVARRLRWSSLRIVALVNAGVDVVAIGFILYASGGVSSGLGILLALPVLALSLLASTRDALLIAALAALSVLGQEFAVGVGGQALPTDYSTAGVLGGVLFVIALAVWPVASRLRESEALVRRHAVDLANMAQLSQYVVQHLRESLLVVDPQDRIRLINEPAAQILGDGRAFPGALLGEVAPRLLYLLEAWRRAANANKVTQVWPGPQPGGNAAPANEPPASRASELLAEPEPTFAASDGSRVIRAHFAPLGSVDPAPVLIFLEDTSLLAERVQQGKLAALGRLSASIAHEIRNPVGAMSHAAQLLAETPQIEPGDRRLTEIIRTNATRVSTIIDNVLRLSRREPAQQEPLVLSSWLAGFGDEFVATMQIESAQLVISGTGALEVLADPGQLRQIVWNLCENALRHGASGTAAPRIELRYGRMTGSGRPFLEVADRGPGVPGELADRIFEPFFSGGRGTGLGLFLARELAQANGGTLLYEPRPGGGSLFRLVFADPRRWEAVA